MRAEESKNVSGEASCWSGSARAQCYDVEANRAFYRGALARLMENAPSFAGQGLDLGCGTGFSLEGLIEKVPEVSWTGADGSRQMVELARRKASLRNASLIQARAESLPFAAASFDVVVANFSWHWFGEGAGDEIQRVLRPGGSFFATVPLRRYSRVSGNRALAHALIADRKQYARRVSQGVRFEDVPGALPKGLRVVRHELVVVSERFADARELLAVLRDRGALAAIFGDQPPAAIKTSSQVDFEWPFALVHAQTSGALTSA